jgi:hypothetical protein
MKEVQNGGDAMNGRPKGKVAPYLILGFLFAFAAYLGRGGVHPLIWVVAVCAFGFMGIGFSNWAVRKGHSGAHALWAVFPIGGLVVLPLLKDRYEDAPPIEAEETEPVKECPNCGTAYKESEYGPQAVAMICSKCRGILPRSG